MASPTDALRQKEAASSVPLQSAALQIDQRLVDHAKNILQAAPLDDETKATLYDHFYDAKSSTELAGKLNGIPVSEELKHQLFTAKKLNDPEPTHFDKVTAAITRMNQMPKATLDFVERFPNVLRAFTSVKG